MSEILIVLSLAVAVLLLLDALAVIVGGIVFAYLVDIRKIDRDGPDYKALLEICKIPVIAFWAVGGPWLTLTLIK